MKNIQIHILKITTSLIVIGLVFFSCEDNFKAVQKLKPQSKDIPLGTAYDINLKYTDSAQLVANLLSKKMIDYTNDKYIPFSEFPDGIILRLFSKTNQKSTIIADYAIYYQKKKMIDLRGNVIVTNETKDSLFTDQLYYYEKLEWIFTDQPSKFKRSSDQEYSYSMGFDSDKDLQNPKVFGITDSSFNFE